MMQGAAVFEGNLSMRAIRRPRTAVPTDHPLSLLDMAEHGLGHKGLSPSVKEWRAKNFPNLLRAIPSILLARRAGLVHFESALSLVVIRKDGTWEDLGLASMRSVTSAGVVFLAADFVGAGGHVGGATGFRFHGIGTGTTAEAASQTTLITELTNEYQTDNTRATGTQASAASGANATFTTVGTNTVDNTVAITEHGLFNQASSPGGTMWDRSLFAVVNLSALDSIQSTYVLTIQSGG